MFGSVEEDDQSGKADSMPPASGLSDAPPSGGGGLDTDSVHMSLSQLQTKVDGYNRNTTNTVNPERPKLHCE